MLIAPESGFSKPATHRRSVVFPDPDGPRITVKVPEVTLRETPLTAWGFPYFFDTLSISMLAIVGESSPMGAPSCRQESLCSSMVPRNLCQRIFQQARVLFELLMAFIY